MTSPSRVPSGPAEVTAAWLGAVLRGPGPSPSRIEGVEPIGEGYGLASERIRVRLGSATSPSSVVVKLWGFEDPADAREVHFYRTLAGRSGVRLPVCHHADLDERAGRAVLVLEDLAGATQGDCLRFPSPAQAIAIAETLAAVHASWWERTEIGEAAWLPEEAGVRTPEWLASRTHEFLRRFEDRVTPLARDLLARGPRLQTRVHERLEGAPWTLLHGDLHLDNVLFERSTGRPVLLDWSRAARGPFVLDLADTLFGVVGAGDREAALAAYVREARARSATVPGDAELRRHLGGGLLRFFFRATCGIARWRPGSDRESRMIDAAVQRAMSAVAEWREQGQDLFAD